MLGNNDMLKGENEEKVRKIQINVKKGSGGMNRRGRRAESKGI